MTKTFLYFAYGSNLWSERILLNNKSAAMKYVALLKVIQICIFTLQIFAVHIAYPNPPEAASTTPHNIQGYKLEFGYWAKRWGGAAANIYPDINENVYGVLWELNEKDHSSLDIQEGVPDRIYKRLPLTVETTVGQLSCLAYQLCEETRELALQKHGDNLKPSKVYKDVMIRGAVENKLPEDYIDFLRNIPDNGYEGEVDVNINLNLQ